MRALAEIRRRTLCGTKDVESVKIKVPYIDILRVASMHRIVRNAIDASIYIDVSLHP